MVLVLEITEITPADTFSQNTFFGSPSFVLCCVIWRLVSWGCVCRSDIHADQGHQERPGHRSRLHHCAWLLVLPDS